jgi:broad specificity phosphatase PhoE
VEALAECDLGRWDGLTWDPVRQQDPEAHQRFLADPWPYACPAGEALADVHRRAASLLAGLLEAHAGEVLLVVAHQNVLRAWLTPLLGLELASARQLTFANGGLSLVQRRAGQTAVRLLNDVSHLR